MIVVYGSYNQGHRNLVYYDLWDDIPMGPTCSRSLFQVMPSETIKFSFESEQVL